MVNDGRSPAETCACCGRGLPVSDRLALSVEAAVLDACNRAYAEAERRGDARVEEAHLVACLARAPEAIQVFWQFGLAASEWLEASEHWLSRHAQRRSGEQIETSAALKALLARAQDHALREARTHASLSDLVAAIAGQRGAPAAAFTRRDGPHTAAMRTRREEALPLTTAPPPTVARAANLSPFGRLAVVGEKPHPIPSHPPRTDDAATLAALLARLDRQDALLAELRAALLSETPAADAAAGARGATSRRHGDRNAPPHGVRHPLAYRPDIHALTTASTSERLFMRLSLRRRRNASLRRKNRSAEPPSRPAATSDRDLRLIAEQAVTRARRRLRAGDHRAHDEAPSPHPERDDDLSGAGERGKRFFLALDDHVERAPSIGAKTAARLSQAGIATVRDLLVSDPETLAARVRTRHITAQRLRDWQAQARLVCTVPWLRGTHAQLLVGAGYAALDRIVAEEPSAICAAILKFATTRDGQGVLRSGPPPDMERILKWIENIALAEPDRAAA
jgi:hypothetical protein